MFEHIIIAVWIDFFKGNEFVYRTGIYLNMLKQKLTEYLLKFKLLHNVIDEVFIMLNGDVVLFGICMKISTMITS